MKLVRYGEWGKEKPGVRINEDEIVDISEYEFDYDPDFFTEGWLENLAAWLDDNRENAPKVRLSETRIGAPLSLPGKIICVGQNYHAHIKETGAKVPGEPVLFMKATSALNGPYDPVEIPRQSQQTDWEVELAVVIGKKAKYVEEEHALEYIAGYTIMNDISERQFQKERFGQWTKGKSHDTFAPLGPCIVTRDELRNVQNLEMTLEVNGERMQAGNTNDMIFPVKHLIAYISQFMTLHPGDIVSTGTPPGVGLGQKPPRFLQPGDTIEAAIAGLGSQKQSVISA